MTIPSIDTAPPQVSTDIELVVASNEELERPYRVIIENDDVTPMDFVILILLSVFTLSIERAEAVMLEAHYHGEAHVTTLPYREAHELVYQAHSIAHAADYPLRFYLEPDA